MSNIDFSLLASCALTFLHFMVQHNLALTVSLTCNQGISHLKVAESIVSSTMMAYYLDCNVFCARNHKK